MLRHLGLQPCPVWELGGFEVLGAIKKIWEVEVRSVVSNDDVGVYLLYEVAPFQQHLFLVLKCEKLGSRDRTNGIHAEDVADERLLFSESRDDVRNLDDGVDLGLRKDTLATSALDIHGKYAERRALRIFAFGRVCNQISVINLGFDLTVRMSLARRDQLVLPNRGFYPGHADDLQDQSYSSGDVGCLH